MAWAGNPCQPGSPRQVARPHQPVAGGARLAPSPQEGGRFREEPAGRDRERDLTTQIKHSALDSRGFSTDRARGELLGASNSRRRDDGRSHARAHARDWGEARRGQQLQRTNSIDGRGTTLHDTGNNNDRRVTAQSTQSSESAPRNYADDQGGDGRGEGAARESENGGYRPERRDWRSERGIPQANVDIYRDKNKLPMTPPTQRRRTPPSRRGENGCDGDKWHVPQLRDEALAHLRSDQEWNSRRQGVNDSPHHSNDVLSPGRPRERGPERERVREVGRDGDPQLEPERDRALQRDRDRDRNRDRMQARPRPTVAGRKRERPAEPGALPRPAPGRRTSLPSEGEASVPPVLTGPPPPPP